MLKATSTLEVLQVAFQVPKAISCAPNGSNNLFSVFKGILVFCEATNPIFVASLIWYIWILKFEYLVIK